MVEFALAMRAFVAMLEMANERVKYMPEEDKPLFWKRFDERMEPINKLIDWGMAILGGKKTDASPEELAAAVSAAKVLVADPADHPATSWKPTR